MLFVEGVSLALRVLLLLFKRGERRDELRVFVWENEGRRHDLEIRRRATAARSGQVHVPLDVLLEQVLARELEQAALPSLCGTWRTGR